MFDREFLIRHALFLALVLIAPALVFLIQVVFIIPTALIPTGIVYMFLKMADSGLRMESLWISLFFGLHALIFIGLYWMLAWLLARLLASRAALALRLTLAGLVAGALIRVALLPVYGGGGHGPMHLSPLPEFLGSLIRQYDLRGLVAALITLAALALLPPLWRVWRRRRSRAAEKGA